MECVIYNRCAIYKISNDGDLIQPQQLGMKTVKIASSEHIGTLLMKVGNYVCINCREK